MSKVCPKCSSIFGKLSGVSIISGFSSPIDGDKHCVECGTELIDSDLQALANCPDCQEPRREKPPGIAIIMSTIDPNAKYVRFCHKCGHDFIV